MKYAPALVALALLTTLPGCDEKKPSASTIKSQLNSELASCKVISLEGFEKQNGFVQPDGSYLEDIAFDLSYSPSGDMSALVSSYKDKYDSLQETLKENEPKAKAVINQVQNIDCRPGYLEQMAAVMAEVDKLLKSRFYENIQGTDRSVDVGNFFPRDLSAEMMPQQLPAVLTQIDAFISKMQANKTEIGPDGDPKELESYNSGIAVFTKIKSELTSAVDENTSCEGGRAKLIDDNKDLLDSTDKAKNELGHLMYDTENKAKNTLDRDCSHLSSPMLGYVISMVSGAISQSTLSYASPAKYHFKQELHMIKSDNGWIISN